MWLPVLKYRQVSRSSFLHFIIYYNQISLHIRFHAVSQSFFNLSSISGLRQEKKVPSTSLHKTVIIHIHKLMHATCQQGNERYDHNKGFVITGVCYFALLRNGSQRFYPIEESGYLGYIMVISMSIIFFEGTTYKCIILDKTSNKADFNIFCFFLIIKKEFSVIYRSTAFIHVFFRQPRCSKETFNSIDNIQPVTMYRQQCSAIHMLFINSANIWSRERSHACCCGPHFSMALPNGVFLHSCNLCSLPNKLHQSWSFASPQYLTRN